MADQSIECSIASTSYATIEFPGLVRNAGRAERMLGGLDAITMALQSRGKDGLMRLSYRPDDPSAGLTIGEPQSSNCLVMRISRMQHRMQGAEQSPPHVSIVGRVSKHYKFSSLVDFQYLPIDPLDSGRQNRSDGVNPLSEASGRQEGLLLIPPIFSRAEPMAEHSFKPAKAAQLAAPAAAPVPQAVLDPPIAISGDDDLAYNILED